MKLITVVCLVGGLLASPAQAHFKIKRPANLNKKPLKTQLFYWEQNYLHAHEVIVRIKKRTKNLRTLNSASNAHKEQRLRIKYKNHRWLLKTTERNLQAVKHEIAAKEIPSDYPAWNCIHSHEASWDANTGNGYYGGLQMDMSFQRTYGSEYLDQWGTANNWPVWAQIEAARRARDGYAGYKARYYSPWPRTAAACGLY